MRRPKRQRPPAVCNVCGAFADGIELVNHRCRRVVHGRRCYGVLRSELTHVWAECQACGATGILGTRPCEACGGQGWRLVA